MMAIAITVTVFGTLAAATAQSPGVYGLEHGSVSWPSQQVSSDQEIVQLGGNAGQTGLQEQTGSLAQLGSDGSSSSSQEQAVAAVQLGSSSQLGTQKPASGTVQLSGYFDNMESYTNIFYSSIMLGGSFGSSGGGGCGCCG